MARIAALLAALGITAGNFGLREDGRIPENTREWVTTAVIALAGLVAPSIVRIPDPAKAQLYGVVGTLVAAGLNLVAQKALEGNVTANTTVVVLTLLASLLAPGVHLHNAPGVDRESARLPKRTASAGPEV